MNVTLPYRAKIGPRSILSEEIYVTFNASLWGEMEDGQWRMEDGGSVLHYYRIQRMTFKKSG
jgi:hypothetical protein